MSRGSCLIIVQDLARQQAIQEQIDRFYTEVAYELGQQGVFCGVLGVEAQRGVSEYEVPAPGVTAFGYLYDGHWMDQTDLRSIESVSAYWRGRNLHPFAVTKEGKDAKAFQLYPSPQVDGSIIVNPDSLGADFPRYDVHVIAGVAQTDLPDWVDLPVAYAVLAREYMRESNHMDHELAAMFKQLSELFFSMMLYGEEAI